MKRQTIIILSIFSIGLVIASGMYALRGQIRNWWFEYSKEEVPEAITFSDIAEDTGITDGITDGITETKNINKDTDDDKNTRITEDTENNEVTSAEGGSASGGESNENTKKDIVIPESINLAIPFTSQAPHANWDLPYQEACEEASMLMSARFLQGRGISGPDDADQAILQLVDHGSKVMGYPIDTTAEQTAKILENFYDLDTELVYDFSWDDVKQALAQGYPVMMPAAGRQLGNPNFTSPGPVYHMLVIKGYTTSVVITNDPGTRRGADYQYSYDTLYNAAHDWNSGDVTNGAKVIIIVKPKTNE